MIDIIAEIGSNHGGDLNRALLLIEQAAFAGATTVKFQLFGKDNLWRPDDPRHAATRPLALPEVWLPRLKQQCSELGVNFLCTPFSPVAIDVLERIGVDRYKIASGDITFIPLLKRIAATKKPVILSTGFAEFHEIRKALDLLDPTSLDMVTLLHCTGGYPTPANHANLPRILQLVEHFWTPVGLSSHWQMWYLDIACIGYNITTIEKHFGDGAEAGHSLNPEEFKQFVEAVRATESAMVYSDTFCKEDIYARKHYRRDESDWLRPIK